MADADLTLRDDVEKVAYEIEKRSNESPPSHDQHRGSVTPLHDGFFSAFTLESFKCNPNARVVTEATDLEGRPLPDQTPAEPALDMKLKPRHLQMIAIGGSIGMFPSDLLCKKPNRDLSGTGLFVGSGSALATGGPVSIIIAYGLIGVMLFCTVHALGELAVAFPIAGTFSVYSSRFIDPAWGFAMGWK
jgi:yeast amino acid transporter